MLPKKRRLTTKLLDEVMVSGRIFHSPILSLKAIKVIRGTKDTTNKSQKSFGKSRFAAVASKKYFKTAVMRNRMRRRTYAALTDVVSYMDKNAVNMNGNIFHCILMIKPTALDIDQSDLKQAIHEIFVKSRIIT
jgi:ribonuclease P protein component